MSQTNSQPNEAEQAQPMQIGTTPGEVADLIEEIGHSGVASSPAQVEEIGVLGRDHDTDRWDEPAMPIITSD